MVCRNKCAGFRVPFHGARGAFVFQNASDGVVFGKAPLKTAPISPCPNTVSIESSIFPLAFIAAAILHVQDAVACAKSSTESNSCARLLSFYKHAQCVLHARSDAQESKARRRASHHVACPGDTVPHNTCRRVPSNAPCHASCPRKIRPCIPPRLAVSASLPRATTHFGTAAGMRDQFTFRSRIGTSATEGGEKKPYLAVVATRFELPDKHAPSVHAIVLPVTGIRVAVWPRTAPLQDAHAGLRASPARRARLTRDWWSGAVSPEGAHVCM